ncbi:IclR family transcriptional regulator [Bounagaea algeriensis]
MSDSQPSPASGTDRAEAPSSDLAVEGQGRGPLHSLLNGIRVLEAFSVSEPMLGVSEIARRVELHKSTASRVLATLQQADLVERDANSGRYRLGLGIIGLAGPLLAHLDVRSVTYSALDELVELTGETAALSVWSGHESIVVEQIPSPKQVKHTTPLGTRFSKIASATVQVFLAEQNEPEVRRLIRHGLLSATTGTEDDVAHLLERLATIHERGYALNDGETDPEELSVAAPIRDHRSTAVAAVLLSVPRSRSNAFLIDDYVRRVCEVAQNVSARLGAGRG